MVRGATSEKGGNNSMTEEITDDQLFKQIMITMQKMSGVIQSHEAQIQRLQFRIDRLEKSGGSER